MKIGCMLILFWGSFLQAFTLTIINDTPFFLTAVVQGDNGITITSEALRPQQKKKLDIDVSRGQLSSSKNFSYTPMIVFWRCPNGGLYGISSQVMPGTWVAASLSAGQKYCEVPQKKDNR